MKNIKLIHIVEPLLSFGYNQKTIDPRDGITLFGPYSREIVKSITVGVIGAKEGRRKLKDWLIKIKNPVMSKEIDIARPFFPGIEAAFNFDVDIENIQEIDVETTEISKFLKYTDGSQRVYNLVDVYTKKLIKYKNEEEIPVTVWFVVIPEGIYTYGRPKSRIPSASDNIKIGISKKEDRLNTPLFEEDQPLINAYSYEINFHNQLKAKLLNDGIITQIVRENTIAYREIFTPEQIISEEKFDSAKAWNIATTLYYKSGGLPWKLGDIRDGVCYVGLVYKKVDNNSDSNIACCAAQMFLDSGDGMVFKGNVGPWYNPDSKEYHLSKKSAFDLLQKALTTFKDKRSPYPKEIFIHAKTYFSDDEWEGFLEAAEGKSKVIGVRIISNNIFKLYRAETYAVPRGTALLINEKHAYLWTKGFIPRLQTQIGLETPNPLDIRITKGSADLETVCRDVLSLTKLNYNSCIYADGNPVTLRFADMIGEVLTAGPLGEIKVLPFKHYV